MKKIMIVSLTLFTLITSAAQAGTLLSYRYNNGTVAPKYAKTYLCNISAAEVNMVFINKMTDENTQKTKRIQFTNDVPNVSVLKSLMIEASRHPNVHNSHYPIGGSMQTYEAVFSVNKSLILLQKTGGDVVTEVNASTAGNKLVQFIDLNCALSI